MRRSPVDYRRTGRQHGGEDATATASRLGWPGGPAGSRSGSCDRSVVGPLINPRSAVEPKRSPNVVTLLRVCFLERAQGSVNVTGTVRMYGMGAPSTHIGAYTHSLTASS